MNLSRDDLMKLGELADRGTMKDVYLPSPPECYQFPIITRLIGDAFSLQKQQAPLLLPELRTNTSTIAVFSDYGGESPGSRYNTYTFLVCAYDQLDFFWDVIQKHREFYFSADERGKEYAFKDRKYGPIKRSLSEYLRKIDIVPGLLFSLVVNRDVKGLLSTTDTIDSVNAAQALCQAGFGIWKPAVARKVLIVCHVIAYLIALHSRDKQEIMWMSDHDSILEGDKHQQAVNILCSLLPYYTRHEFSLIGGAVPFPKPDTDFRDLLSVTDLVAGSLEHYFTRLARFGLRDLTVDSDSDQIMQWLANHGLLLKKHAIVIEPEDNGLVDNPVHS